MTLLQAVRPVTETVHTHTCDSYGPGHMLHWTQWKAASGAPSYPVTRIVDHGDHFELHVVGQPPLRWCHHEPDRLRAALESAAAIVEACPRFRALRVDGFWFNCAPLGSQMTLCG